MAQQTQKTGLQLFNNTLKSVQVQEYLQMVLGKNKETFVTSLTSIVANDSKLQACEPMSLMYAGIKAASLNLPLDPNLGYAYVIPYDCKEKRTVPDGNGGFREVTVTTTKAQFQMGYKGFVQLGLRSGQLRLLNVTDIREGELKGRNLLTGEIIVEAAENRETLPIIGYAAYMRLINGFDKSVYWTVGEVEAHALRYSQTYRSEKKWVKESSKWTTDFDAMACKTVLKMLLSKSTPLSLDMQHAVAADQAVFSSQGELTYPDNPENPDIQEATFEEVKDELEARKEAMRQTKEEAPAMP